MRKFNLRHIAAVGGTLSVTSPYLAADFDENGAVNGLDLDLWRGNFGLDVGASHTQGDANADGAVSGADFLIWQRQVGLMGAMAAGTSVPEPASVAALFGVLLLGSVRRR